MHTQTSEQILRLWESFAAELYKRFTNTQTDPTRRWNNILVFINGTI